MTIDNGVKAYTDLLDQIANHADEAVTPDWFTEKSHAAYALLLDELEASLLEGDEFHYDRYQLAKEQLEILHSRAKETENGCMDDSKPETYSPYRAALAIYTVNQLAEAIELIKPENLLG